MNQPRTQPHTDAASPQHGTKLQANQPQHKHHDHGTHNHGMGAPTRRLAVALGITALVLVGELLTAHLSGSLALLADAGHMATDSIGLVVALVAAHLATRPPTDNSTWGLRRAEVVGAAMQATTLTLVGLSVAWHAIAALITPTIVHSHGVLVMGVVGLAANALSLLVLAGGRGHNLNMRAAFLEVTGDALGSVAVIVGALVADLTGWQRADAVTSLVIVALIVPRALVLLREAGRTLMDLTPTGLDLHEVRRHLSCIDGVLAIHDLHAWKVSSGLPVLTAHVVVTDQSLDAQKYGELLDTLQQCVAEHFPLRVEHATFQLEPARHQTHELLPCT